MTTINTVSFTRGQFRSMVTSTTTPHDTKLCWENDKVRGMEVNRVKVALRQDERLAQSGTG